MDDGPHHHQRHRADLISFTMNRFLKKKGADAPAAHDEALHALSQPPSPQLKKSATSKWKKNKKPQPEIRPQLDLKMALPSTDDFRTSLLMPSLSTRFSMLREQDDPTSLLGKASDDSVLQPRRRSRLGDFGLSSTGLGDIAEVSSIHDSVRPPFADRGREQSYVSEDGYGSDADAHTGSVMSRSRPGEGNVLFGGRQKVYKIPNSGAVSTKSLGRFVYDGDVGMSAFQKHRQRERDYDQSLLPRPSDESQGFDFGLDKGEPDYQDDDGQHSLLNDSAKDLCHSPSLSSYDRKRSTTSSDARSIARSSTAATSVASQPATSGVPSPVNASSNTMAPTSTAMAPADRTNTKGRRLYEQGLDQHMQEQQTSAMTRLNSIQRQRALSGKKIPPFLHSTKSASNLQERTASPVFALRGQSPPLTSPIPQLLTNFGSIKHANSASPSPAPSGPHSPVDGQVNDLNVLAQALEPADRGKATALGAFNKPAHAFDEQQYLERQRQLQRSTSSAAIKNKVPSRSPFQSRFDRFEQEQNVQRTASPDISSRSRSPSATRSHEPTSAYNVFQNALNQFPAQAVSKSPVPDTHRTFFGNISASEDEDEEEVSEIAQSFNQPEYGYGGYHSKWQPTILPSVSEHPALRSHQSSGSFNEDQDGFEGQSLRHAGSSRSVRSIVTKPGADVPKALDSPTLPEAQSMGGMNGMVHHLRQQSNQSSVYQGDDGLDADDYPDVQWNVMTADHDGHQSSTLDVRESLYTPSNPWDLDEANSVIMETNQPHSDTSSVEPSIRQPEANLLSSHPTLGGVESERSSTQDVMPTWQQELRKQHTRDTSSATAQERDAFSRELAARRDAVKENLRSVVETNGSRSGSPIPSPLNVSNNSLRAFGMLRAKTSRESLVSGREPPKAFKTLGINASSGDRTGFSLDMARARGNSSPRIPMPPTSQHPAFKNAALESAGEHTSNEAPRERQLASSRSNAADAGNRSRSNSATTRGRSDSRTGPYRDDLEKAMTEGRGSSANLLEVTPEASPAVLSNRDSDGSRAGMQAYFDLKASQTRLASNGPTPAATPTGATAGEYLPGRPVPMANPYSENPTPPLSGSSPTINVAAYSPVIPSSARGPGLRKRTITKSDISEPTLISSTSNVDTVDLPPGASLKNGMDEVAPPLPPINPRRRGTRKLFGLASKNIEENNLTQAICSDPHPLSQTSPRREAYIAPGNVVRLQAIETGSPPMQYGMDSHPGSPERITRNGSNRTGIEGGMF